MNKTQLKQLTRALELTDEAKGIVEEVLQDARDTLDGKSDKWLESEKGEAAQALVATLEGIFEKLEDADSEIAGLDGMS